MTPEQKAFCEYGEARGLLKARISKCRRDARYVFGRNYQCLYSAEKENIWILNNLESLIKDYQKKRAACRIERHCGNCERCNHEGDMWGEVNSFCTLPTRACLCVTDAPDDFCCNYWEPQKKGK